MGDPGGRSRRAARLVEHRRRGIEYATEHLVPPSGGVPPGPGDGAFVILTNDGPPSTG